MVTLCIDNQNALYLIKNGIVNKRSKHIEVKFHYIHSLVTEKLIEVKYSPTTEQLADILTKPLDHVKFKELKAHTVVQKTKNSKYKIKYKI